MRISTRPRSWWAGAAVAGLLLGTVPTTAAQAASGPVGGGSPVGGLAGTALGLVQGAASGLGSSLGVSGWLFDADQSTSLSSVRAVIGASAPSVVRYDGTGVGVALIDTGVVGVPGLTSGNVRQGPDLSFDAQTPALAHLDAFGHGTHMAGIIAGRDTAGPASQRFTGVAPGARLTSVKLSPADASVDVSQMIAALDWVVAHRNDDRTAPIRVVNLSFGTDAVQRSQVDPLAHAVENAWRAGIVVVAAGGNGGGRLDDPAYDPFVLAVGASDTRGTTGTLDDTVPSFSARGDSTRRVDVVAPGVSIASLRDPGSALDRAYPAARASDARLFHGSGTSQAAAVVTGAVAVLLQARPNLTPDQVKQVLRSSAAPLALADPTGRGAGSIDLAAALRAPTPTTKQAYAVSTGTGTLEGSRGSVHVYDGDTALTGERDIFGPFDTKAWARASSAGTAWSGGSWMGHAYTGACACDTTWSGPTWSAAPWDGTSWDGRAWRGRAWKSDNWSGRAWHGSSWS